MLRNLTTETLEQIGELARASMAAEWAADPDKRVWRSCGELGDPRPPTPERMAMEGFIRGLPDDHLIEVQACFWLGRDHTPDSGVTRALSRLLEHSRRDTD